MSVIENERKQRIETLLANHTETRQYEIEVEDDNGVITLTGKVPKDVRDLVEELVTKQEGVTSVINELDVKDEEEEPIVVAPSSPPARPINKLY